MSTLAIVLPLAGDAPPSWAFALQSGGSSPPQHGEVPIALLPRADGAVQVAAVVPAAALSWHRIELPQGVGLRSPRLRPVLEGLLEDRLLDDPAALHFALEPDARPAAPAWVAVCDRDWLRRRLQELDAVGRGAARLVPEFEPTAVRALHATASSGEAVLTATGAEGVLQMPLAMFTATALAPWNEASLLAEPAVAQEAESALGRSPVLQSAGDRWLQAAASRWELAQFDFAQARQSRRMKAAASLWASMRKAPEWRAARWGVALVIAANLIGLNAMAWKERDALERKRSEVLATLTRTFPGASPYEPALQMQRHMALLRQESGALAAGDLEPVLEALAQAGTQGQRPTAIEFGNGETRIKGIDADPDVLAVLRERGLQARTEAGALALRAGSTP